MCLAWSSRCIAGRAILIDYASYAEENAIQYDPLTRHGVPLDAVKAIAQKCGISFQQGDIFILRTGYIKAYASTSSEERQKLAAATPHPYCGLGQGRDMTEWLWERQFAAVAADSPGFECNRMF